MFVRDWLTRFPREKLLFLRTEDFKKTSAPAILEEVFTFLDLGKPANGMDNVYVLFTKLVVSVYTNLRIDQIVQMVQHFHLRHIQLSEKNRGYTIS